MSKVELKLDWCTHEAAKYAVEKWHYSKKLQTGKTAKIGVWEDDCFIGMLLFTNGSGKICQYFNVTPYELVELARVALNKHQTPVSRIIKIALKMIRIQYPKVKVIVSYADPYQNHHGGIYQAGNWVYLGKTANNYFFTDHTGRTVHKRSVSDTGFVMRNGKHTKAVTTKGLTKVNTPGKHRYAIFLDDELREQFRNREQPYPKRVTSIDSDVSGNQSEEGGASPTVTLHKSR